MLYMLFATQMPPPGHVERIIFVHPGNAQEVQQYAAQLIGVKPAVQYQLANLLQQPRPTQPAIYCRQIRPIAVGTGASAGMGETIGQGPSMGPRDLPSELRGVRPDTQVQHQVAPSPLGDRYNSVPPDLLGEFV